MKKHSLALTLAIAMLAGCQALPTGLQPQSATGIAGVPAAARALEARVALPAPRRILATEAEVKSLATVSLMTMGGATLASGVTDTNGAVTLTLGQDVNLIADTCYVLEAVKGLGGNAPGKSAVRLRTIVRWTAEGWTSLTSATAGAPATIDSLTTAVAITVGLHALDPATLMGLVDPAAGGFTWPDALLPSQPDPVVLALAESVSAYVTGDLDPIATANGLMPEVTSLSATTGPVGTILTINGTGFNPLPNQVSVNIGGLSATVIAATPTAIYCVVPGLAAGAHQVGVGSASGGTFTVTEAAGPKLTSASPANLYEGATLTLMGTGFDPVAAANRVMFGTVPVTPTAATETELTVTVPAGFGTAVTVLVPGAKSNTLTVPEAPTTALAITPANKAWGGAWATGSLGRDLTGGYPNPGTGVDGIGPNPANPTLLPTTANYETLTLADNLTMSSSETPTVYVQGDVTLGTGSKIHTNGSAGGGSSGFPATNLTLHIGGQLVMGANSAITANGADGNGGPGGSGGVITIYAHGFSLHDTAKIEAKGGAGTTPGTDGSINMHHGTTPPPESAFNPMPTFSVIQPSTAPQEAVSKAYDIGGDDHAAVTYLGFAATENKPSGTNITYAFADSADGTTWSSWATDIKTLTKRHIRFKATMTTDDVSKTPTLSGLTVQYLYP